MKEKQRDQLLKKLRLKGAVSLEDLIVASALLPPVSAGILLIWKRVA